MKDHQRTIARQLHIQFDHVDTELQRSLERRKGMFRSAAGRTAVRNAQPPSTHGRGIVRGTHWVNPLAIARAAR